jgi:hypothetical protein
MTSFIVRGPSGRRFARHYLEMIAAMVAGMVVLGPAESVAFGPIGWAHLRADSEIHSLIMATNMTVAMTVWMRCRRHRWASIGEMAGAMYGSFLVFFPLLWLGVLSATGLMVAGHAVMPFAMAAAMLWRLEEYAGPTHSLTAAVGARRSRGVNGA